MVRAIRPKFTPKCTRPRSSHEGPAETRTVLNPRPDGPPACHTPIHQCRFIDMNSASALFRLLGDEARLRILRLLSLEQLNVSELTGILGIAQSGVSRHLGLLKEADLVSERREGGYTFFRLAPSLSDDAPTARRWRRSSAARSHAASGDLTRMRRCPAGGGPASAQGELRRACRSGHQRTPARAGPELGGVGARAGAPAAAASCRRSRLRRGLPDDRNEPLGRPRHRGRSL